VSDIREREDAGPETSEQSDAVRSKPPQPLFSVMGYIGGVNVLAFGVGIVRQKVFAVFLGAAGFGAYSLAAALFDFLASAARAGLHTGVLREMSAALGRGERGSALRLLVLVRRAAVLFSVLLAGGIALAAEPISATVLHGQLPPWAVRVVALAIPFLVATGFADAGLNAFGEIRRLAVGKAVGMLLSLGATVALVAWLGLPGAVIQIATGAVLGWIVLQSLLRRPVAAAKREAAAVTASGVALRSALLAVGALGLAQSVHHIILSGNLFVFRSLIVAELGVFNNGIYQGVMGLSRQYTTALMSGVFVYLYPSLSALARDRERFAEELASVGRVMLAVSVPLALALLATRDWIVPLVFTREFSGMVPLMAFSAIGDVPALTASMLHVSLLAAGRPLAYGVLGALAGVLNLGLFYWGLTVFGLTGAVGAYVAFGCVELAMMLAYLTWGAKIDLGGRFFGQIFAAIPLLAGAALLPAGAWTTRLICVVLAVGWIGLWRKDLERGVKA